jgi:basic membrane lipoprotein Med (substrate-binding protein (PBP1-ABC) superfamily)
LIFAILYALLLAGFIASASADELNKSVTSSELKAELLDFGPIGDHGWTYEGHMSAARMAKKLPYVKLSERENAAGLNASQIIREYADNGYKLIICHSGDFHDALQEVAPDYPHVIFLHEGRDEEEAANVGTYFVKTYEVQYLLGMVAGNMTQTDKIAFVTPFPDPELVIDINAFARGVAFTNPKARVFVEWIGGWYDPEKEKQVASSLIDKGCDVITHTSDADATGETAEKEGVYFLSYGSNMARFFPHVFLTGVVWNFEPAMTDAVEVVYNGTWYTRPKQVRHYGLAEDGAQMAPFSDLVPDRVRALVKERQEEIVEGELAVFPGMSDDELWKTYYFEPNVVGELPKL